MKKNSTNKKFNSQKVTTKSTRKSERGGKRAMPMVIKPFRFGMGEGPSKVTTVVSTRGCLEKKSAANKIGTLDNAIRERHIFTALGKMPDEILLSLLENGWIGKSHLVGGKNKKTVLSLHKNIDRVRTVIKRYDSGLIWMNDSTTGLDWSSLDPNVLVNRFPRDKNETLKLCSLAMTGYSEFDDYYPRSYQIDDQTTTTRHFLQDYSLTACTALLDSFVGNDGYNVKVANNGKIPLMALHFAINICNQFIRAQGIWTNCSFTDNIEDWKTFFDYFHQVVHEGKKFLGIKSSKEILDLTNTCKQVLEKLRDFRPQMSIDRCKNVWIIKCQQHSNQQPLIIYKIEDVLNKFKPTKGGTYILQKYIETPLLNKNSKFNVHVYVLISTLDECLTVWVYQTCYMKFYLNKFSLNIDDSRGLHSKSNKVSMHAPVKTCHLSQLKGRLRSLGIKKTGGNSAIYMNIKKSIVTSVVAAVDVLNWRPNCFEMFEATFVLGNDLHPWLIDIKSDPCLDYEFNFAMSSLTNGIAKNIAKVLMMKNRTRKNKIGKFDLIHKSALPKNYKPRAFVEKPISRKRDTAKHKIHKSFTRDERVHIWNDDNIKTYIENIHVVEDEDYQFPRQISNPIQSDEVMVNEELADGLTWGKLNVVDLKNSMSRIIKGNVVDVYEAKHCLHLLEKWKKRVLAAQKFYRRTLERSAKNQTHKIRMRL